MKLFHGTLAENNDTVLSRVIEAPDGAERDDAIADVIACRARTVIDRVLGPYRRSGFALSPQDVDDIAATVSLRLLRKLRAVGENPAEAITRFDDYVATLTYHSAYDFFRRRYPRRARLKNRLRYVMTRDCRLALWGGPDATLAGLAEWRGRAAAEVVLERRDATAAMLDSAHTADAVTAIFEALGAPVPFDDLVRLVAELWSVVDLREAPAEPRATQPTQLASVESQDTLRQVWSEIRDLPPRQRCALLLNLREGQDGDNAVALLVLSGIATLGEIAETLEMSVSELSEMWARLPIDDLQIAERLGLTRQQVINLRKSARARLARRIAARGGAAR